MAKQLNVFVENRPGRLESVAKSLRNSDINVRAFAIQDRGDFGLMKLIVDKPKQAQLALAEQGFACAMKDTLAVSVPDQPGNLHKLMAALAENQINIIDAYGFVLDPSKQGVCCVEIENLPQTNAAQAVEDAGFTILEDEQLYNL